MKVIDFKGLVDKANGKVCKHSNISVAFNPRTRACWSVTRHPESYGEYAPSQLQQQTIASFTERAKVVGAVLRIAKQDQALRDTIITMRDDLGLHSMNATIARLYDKEGKSITISGVKYTADSTADTADNGGSVDTPPIV